MISVTVAVCDVCKTTDEADLYYDEGDPIARCTDCYLRHHGYNPDAIAEQFAYFAKRIIGEQLESMHNKSETTE